MATPNDYPEIIDAEMTEVLSMLEAEPTSAPSNAFPVASTQPDIPVLREQLAVLVSTAQEISEPQESQVTSSQTPATRTAKNPKRVAAGKMVAERTRMAREAQKKAAAEAAIVIENNRKAKATASPAPDPAPVPETEPKPAAADSNGLSTNQWISIIGIGATLFATYVKRDDLKAFFGKKQAPPPEPAPQVAVHESPPQPKKGIRPMDD